MNRGRRIYSITTVALMAALLSVGAMLTVPVTLQTLALYLSLLVIGGSLTLASVTVYLALGALGVPVFSGFSGGVGRLFDATGGFLFGMLVCALLYWLLERRLGRGLSLALSTAALHLCGVLWYTLGYLGDIDAFGLAPLVCVVPFIIPEAVKLTVAALTAKRLRRAIKRYL